MSTTELRALLDQVADTRELVLRRAASLGPAFNAVYDAWADAHEEAQEAYAVWLTTRSSDDYAVYRAAQDREDAAQDALSALTRPASAPRPSRCEVVCERLGRELVVREPDPLAALGVDQHDAGGVLQIVGLRLDPVALPDGPQLGARPEQEARAPGHAALIEEAPRAGLGVVGRVDGDGEQRHVGAAVVERAADLVDERRARVLAGRVHERRPRTGARGTRPSSPACRPGRAARSRAPSRRAGGRIPPSRSCRPRRRRPPSLPRDARNTPSTAAAAHSVSVSRA